jgi:hypothetical protein
MNFKEFRDTKQWDNMLMVSRAVHTEKRDICTDFDDE